MDHIHTCQDNYTKKLKYHACHVVITRKEKEQGHKLKDIFLDEDFQIHNHKLNIPPWQKDDGTKLNSQKRTKPHGSPPYPLKLSALLFLTKRIGSPHMVQSTSNSRLPQIKRLPSTILYPPSFVFFVSQQTSPLETFLLIKRKL